MSSPTPRPGLLDLVAAVATGFAGAIALSRKDVAAVLPGVAISISLVPPLAVVGVCLGRGATGLALGALLLFVSNLLTVLTGRVHVVADEWVSAVPGASVVDVELASTTFQVDVQTPGAVPPVGDLLDALVGQVPDGMAVVVTTSLGERIEAGAVGG